MNKSQIIKTAGLLALAVIVVATWMYRDENERQQRMARAEQSIEQGVALFKQQAYDEALRIFESVPPGTPNEWYARYYQGSTYIMLKDYEAATPYLEQALALNPTETQIMHALGVAYFKQGNLKMSKAFYASVLELDPQDEEARGLMDIMTNLEKIQPGASAPETDADEPAGPKRENPEEAEDDSAGTG